MNPIVINNEGPFRTPGVGPGAVVMPLDQVDPKKEFESAYSISKQLKLDAEIEQAKKREKIKGMLGDIDFDTKGVRAKDMDYFLKGKETLHNFYQNALMRGVNPENSEFMKDYSHANLLKKSYSVAVDASRDLNKNLKTATEELYKNPNKYDWEQSVAKIREASQADLPKALELYGSGLLVPKGWAFEPWAKELFDPKKTAFKPEQTVSTNNKGQVIETSGYSKWDPNLKTYPKVQEIASWALRNNPDFRDYISEQWDALPAQVKQEYAKMAETATKNGNPVSAEDFYASKTLEPFAFTHQAFKGETAGARESAKYAFGKGAVKNEFKADIDRYLMLAAGDNSVYQEREGKKLSQYFVGKKVGTYTITNDAGVVAKDVPSYVVSIQHMGKTAEGRPIIRYKTTGTDQQRGQGQVDQDGFVTTNDPNDLIIPMIYSEYGKDATKYVEAYYERAKSLKAWKGGTIDPYVDGVQQLSPEYELEDVEGQAKKIDEDNPANYKPKEEGEKPGLFGLLNKFTSSFFNNTPAQPSNPGTSNGPVKKFDY